MFSLLEVTMSRGWRLLIGSICSTTVPAQTARRLSERQESGIDRKWGEDVHQELQELSKHFRNVGLKKKMLLQLQMPNIRVWCWSLVLNQRVSEEKQQKSHRVKTCQGMMETHQLICFYRFLFSKKQQNQFKKKKNQIFSLSNLRLSTRTNNNWDQKI